MLQVSFILDNFTLFNKINKLINSQNLIVVIFRWTQNKDRPFKYFRQATKLPSKTTRHHQN